MKRDQLHILFKKYLDKMDPESSQLEDLIYDVVGDYMAILMEKGNIPHFFMDHVEADLREEVIEMYRKTTYGFTTLKDYKAAHAAKASRKKAHSA